MSNYWYPTYDLSNVKYKVKDAIQLTNTKADDPFMDCCNTRGIDPVLTGEYKCGASEKIDIKKATYSSEVEYDCSNISTFCDSIQFKLTDEGIHIINTKNGKDNIEHKFRFSTELISNSLTGSYNNELELDGNEALKLNAGAGKDILDDIDISDNSMKMSSVKNNCLVSAGGKFKLFLQKGILRISYFESDCGKKGDYYYGKSGIPEAASIYKIDDQHQHLGKLYTIDQEGQKSEFEDITFKDSNNFKVILNTGSIGNSINSTINDSTRKQCKEACQADDLCAGFEFSDNDKTCRTFDKDNMYPYDQTLKERNEKKTLYVRVPQTNDSGSGCNMSSTHITTNDLYHYNEGSRQAGVPCGSAAVIDHAITEGQDGVGIAVIKQELDVIANKLIKAIGELADMEKQQLKKMGLNVLEMETDLKTYKYEKDRVRDGPTMNNMTGRYEGSINKLNKDMSFLVGSSIVSIVVLLVAINLIKK